MSKVLRLLEDYGDLLTLRHERWIEDSYINPDGDFTADDIPF